MAKITCCRSCGSGDLKEILDLGRQPLANALVDPNRRHETEERYPLVVAFCANCALIQVTEDVPPEVLFANEYPYYSSFIPALLAHSREHALDLIERRKLGPDDLVVEIASNDGYLLKNFREAGIPVLGIDPADGPAEAARRIGVETLTAFFNAATASELVATGRKADVILANNVLAHVSGINEFVEGFAVLLKDDGIIEFEFPYLRDLIEACAFDTIYHEHFFYYSLLAVEPLFERHGLHLNDAVRVAIHGGSVRLTVSKRPGKTDRLEAMMAEEAALGMNRLAYYESFGDRVAETGRKLKALVGELVGKGETIAAYGAAAKGSTLLNYVNIGAGPIRYVVDRNSHKVGKVMPGVGLDIRPVEALRSDRPDYLLILAWNFAAEIMQQQSAFAEDGGRFIVPVPEPAVVQDPLPASAA